MQRVRRRRAADASATIETGTDRLAEVAATLDCDIVVNVQGDEPLIDPRSIDEAVAPFVADRVGADDDALSAGSTTPPS